jgi:hypothetical protein
MTTRNIRMGTRSSILTTCCMPTDYPGVRRLKPEAPV